MLNQQQQNLLNNDAMPAHQYMNTDDEIDLRELFFVVWKGKWLIILITAIFAIGAVTFALLQPNIYKSSVLLAPASGESNQMGALASQFGGLASFAGINLGSGSTSSTDLAIATLKSRKFLTAFVNRHNLKVALFAADKWDESTGELLVDDEMYDVKSNIWIREVESGKSPEPSDWEVYKLFSQLVVISSDKETGLVTLSIELISPILAKQWVEWLILDLNQEMRRAESEEVERNISFLQSQLELTKLADMRTIFYQLIEDQLQTKMLLQVKTEYTFKTIDPAVVAEEKSKPKRALIVVLGILLGGMFATMIVIMRYFMRNTI